MVAAALNPESLTQTPCPPGYAADGVLVVGGPRVQLRFPIGSCGTDFLHADDAEAFAREILEAVAAVRGEL